jgi:predicted site-specific integrase-resolvase
MNTTTLRLLSRRDIAKICNVHPGSVARWERQGLLTAVKLNARVTRYHEDDVSRLVASATCPAANLSSLEGRKC